MNNITPEQLLWIEAENVWLSAFQEAKRLRELADKAKQRWIDAEMKRKEYN